MQLRVGIAGCAGRMGQMVVEQARAAGVAVTAGLDRTGAAASVPGGVGRDQQIEMVADIRGLAAVCEIVIDFTHASTVRPHAAALAEAGVGWVLGTTGLSTEDEAAVARAAARVPVVQAANFSPGVTLVMVLAERMAAALPGEEYDAEIMEMHHRQKLDAPSGTALALGHAVARGRGVAFDEVREPARHGDVGARRAGGIGFAALRGGQVVGEHTLLFAAAGEQIALSHRAFDRRAFAAGAVRAAIWLSGRPAGRYSMRDVLGLD